MHYFCSKKKNSRQATRAFRSPSPPVEQHLYSLPDQMELLRSLASSVTGGWSSRTGRGGSERGWTESPSTPTMAPTPTLALPLLQQQAATGPSSTLSPARNSSCVRSSSGDGGGGGGGGSSGTHQQSPHGAAMRRATRSLNGGMPPLLRRRPSSLGSLDASPSQPPPPSASLPAEQVERYWRLQRRLAATLLPEVVRLEALCAELAAAAAAAEAAGAPSGPSPSAPSSLPRSPPSASPRAGLDPHAATRVAALRRRVLVPLLARLRALPVSETDGSGTTAAAAATSSSSSSSSSRSPPPPNASSSNNPTRADLAALRRAAAVLPRYVEQLRVATRGRPRAFDSGRLCAAAAA